MFLHDAHMASRKERAWGRDEQGWLLAMGESAPVLANRPPFFLSVNVSPIAVPGRGLPHRSNGEQAEPRQTVELAGPEALPRKRAGKSKVNQQCVDCHWSQILQPVSQPNRAKPIRLSAGRLAPVLTLLVPTRC